jgi:hypothetical protein
MPGKYWSIPYGDYPVTPDAPTGAWAHQVGAIPIANNVIPDPQLGRNRIGIMIHSGSAPALDQLYTQGCFKVAPQEWPAVRQQILSESQDSPLYLHVQPGGVAAFTHSKTLEPGTAASPAAAPTAAAVNSANGVSGGGGSSGQPGTTLNSSNVIDTLSKNIAGIESGGAKDPYSVLNPKSGAIGKYQVMPSNVAGWTMAATGQSMTPDEFRASPSAQEAVFRDQMQRNLQLYGPKDAASIWFTGKPYNVAGGAVSDANKTTNASYVARATAGLNDSGTFQPGAAVAASATPGTTLNTPAPGAAPAQGTGTLPGFTPGSPAAKSMADATKSFTNSGAAPETKPFNLQPMGGAAAAGGPMMLGPGGQNPLPQRLAQANLAQQGFQMQPSIGANFTPTYGPMAPQSQQPMAQPGAATGMPMMPGTTLNSPSQLQMAMMSGSLDPYSMYARQPGS